MKTKIDEKYVKAFLINGSLDVLPLREATVLMEEIAPKVCQVIEERYQRFDDYFIKLAYSKVLRSCFLSSEESQLEGK